MNAKPVTRSAGEEPPVPKIVKVIKRQMRTDQVSSVGMKPKDCKFKMVTRYCVYLLDRSIREPGVYVHRAIEGFAYTMELPFTLKQFKTFMKEQGFGVSQVEVFEKGKHILTVGSDGKVQKI